MGEQWQDRQAMVMTEKGRQADRGKQARKASATSVAASSYNTT